MIQTKRDLVLYLQQDNVRYYQKSKKEKIISWISGYPEYKILKFKEYLRKAEYYYNNASKSKLHFLMALVYERKKNQLGKNLGIEIEINCFGPGLEIYHCGIVVNPKARIGKNCRLHGGNCIGNNGKTQEIPIIGDQFDLGYGACVIGDIHIGDNVTVGCNAVVNKSFEDMSVLVGAPAKKYNKE